MSQFFMLNTKCVEYFIILLSMIKELNYVNSRSGGTTIDIIIFIIKSRLKQHIVSRTLDALFKPFFFLKILFMVISMTS